MSPLPSTPETARSKLSSIVGPSTAIAVPPPSHDPVFEQFTPWRGIAPVDRIVNFLGIMERKDFLAVPYERGSTSPQRGQPVEVPYPPIVESYFEWLALLRSVSEYARRAASERSSRPFTMIELGAGFGRWLANAAGAVRSFNIEDGIAPLPSPRLIAVEAEPQHFEWIKTHLSDNHIPFDPIDLHWAACAAGDGAVQFYSGASAAWWGQEIVRAERRAVQQVEGQAVEQMTVPALCLATLLRDEDHVDLIDADIQGAEYEVFAAAGEALDRCVERIIVATHNHAVERSLRAFMGDELHWLCEMDFACKQVNDTPAGPVEFEDGLQVWRNGRFGR